MSQKYLFVCGCPRSGTTALVRLLNSHKLLAIGMERYKYYASKNKINKINKSSFEEKFFFDFQDNQTNITWGYFYRPLKDKYQQGVVYLGDKYPHYYNFYNEIDQEFPNPKWIFMLRDIHDVAMSYNARAANPEDKWPAEADYTKAVVHWNDALAKTWKYLKANKDPKLFVCQYEKIFSYDENYLKSLTNFLEIDLSEDIQNFYSNMTKGWQERMKRKKTMGQEQLDYIQEKAKITLKENLLKKLQQN